VFYGAFYVCPGKIPESVLNMRHIGLLFHEDLLPVLTRKTSINKQKITKLMKYKAFFLIVHIVRK